MATLIRPPPIDPSKAEIENVLELTYLDPIDPNLYTNTRPLWHPPGARGVYGGAVIAQCLVAAQKTVPEDFWIHSMHCYFVLAGNADIPVIYHVENVRQGRSFATRTVQARQRGKAIFTTTMSFVREGAGGKLLVQHEVNMPYVPEPVETDFGDLRLPQGVDGPFQSQRIDILNSKSNSALRAIQRAELNIASDDSPHPHTKKTRQWIKARGRISPAGGHQAHLAAMAYMSDSYFIGTVSRVHKLWRIPAPAKTTAPSVRTTPSPTTTPPWAKNTENSETVVDEDVLAQLRDGDDEQRRQGMEEYVQNRLRKVRPEVSMMVSLDHTIYFHDPRGFRADEWIFTEMETPWAGDGRGLVYQRMWTREGKLIASCVQEGVVRLKQPPEAKL
ncbi:Thioesterase/thiol ester dehydrase-isomerase [Trichodelitschia bisporula]|uniref:Thioesterase/thiol ester dehydrase-isomerase n=1 Tax=Trichodelitschia bisporula TaxID=703511 RepID=A0A6G1HJD2_9PEZI|nr:Thioesterase/thiol ester dehydrase-isomerase [Trichodelitschia bisporula]